MKNPIGIMQGRLLPPIGSRIHAFPAERWQEEFIIAKELGLDCIEFIFEGKDYSRHPLMNVEGINEIKRLQTETDVMVLSVCADYFMDFPLHRGNQNENGIFILGQLITNCSMLDVKDIVIPCVDQSSLLSPDEIKRFVTSLEKCLPLTEKHGINLALETDLSPKEFSELLKSFCYSPSVKVNYDTGNSAALGYDPEEELEHYGKWISDVHIKDRDRGGQTVPLGSGDTNFQLIFQKFKGIGFSGPFILQAARKTPDEERATIREYMGFIKKHLNETFARVS